METIIALATPPLKSALALIRISGDEAFSLTAQLLSKPIDGISAPRIVHATLAYEGKTIDDVVAFLYPASSSMTGEDVVEISCHGSQVITAEIIETYLALGARYATSGEFTARAFYNGKVDLVQAEAINDLINATTRESKDLALLSLSGKTSALLQPLMDLVSQALACVEVGIDYPEYDEEESFTLNDIEAACRDLKQRVETLISEGDRSHYVRNGIDVAFVGEPNVGKSSLFNALLHEDKAIVSAIPGTTRDVVEGEISVKGLPIRLHDTAGIHDTADEIERLGVERSRKILERAEIVVLVYDGKIGKTPQYEELRASLKGRQIIEVCNKTDEMDGFFCEDIAVSALQGEIEPLKRAIYDALHLSDEVFVTPALSSQRELALLRRVHRDAIEALELCEKRSSVDVISVCLQSAYNHMRELLGLTPTQDYSDEIFSRFCVGK